LLHFYSISITQAFLNFSITALTSMFHVESFYIFLCNFSIQLVVLINTKIKTWRYSKILNVSNSSMGDQKNNFRKMSVANSPILIES